MEWLIGVLIVVAIVVTAIVVIKKKSSKSSSNAIFSGGVDRGKGEVETDDRGDF